MDNVRCHYVYDEEEKIVHVDDVSRDTAKSHRYHCISCGAEMIPKLGNLREHHFAHKAACSCNSETYLHKLGKIVFFIRIMYVKIVCFLKNTIWKSFTIRVT